MITFVLIIHIILAIGIIGLVLLQRSEGGGLGIGGGSQSGGFMTARGTANALTKLTTLFGALFFLTSIVLAIMAGSSSKTSVSEEINTTIETKNKNSTTPSVPIDN